MNPKKSGKPKVNVRQIKVAPFVEGDKRLQAFADELDLTDSDFRQFYKIFRSLDKDKSGSLDLEEFYAFINEKRTPFGEVILYNTIGGNRSKPVTCNDFIAAVITYCMMSKLEMQKFVFDTIDVNKNGVICKNELEEMVQWLHRVQSGNVKKAMLTIDYDTNGEVGWKEFLQFLTEYPFIVFPAFRIQETIQKKTLGQVYWDSKSDLRTKKWNEKKRRELGIQNQSWLAELKKMSFVKKLRRLIAVLEPPKLTPEEKKKLQLQRLANKPTGLLDAVKGLNVQEIKKNVEELRARANEAISDAQDRYNEAEAAEKAAEEGIKVKKERPPPDKMDTADLLKSASTPVLKKDGKIQELTPIQEIRPKTTELLRRRKVHENKLSDYNKVIQSIELYDAHQDLQRHDRILHRKKLKKESKEAEKNRAKERADKRLNNVVLFDPAKHVGARKLVFSNDQPQTVNMKKNNWPVGADNDSDLSEEEV